jgi:hypothetical protein
MPEPTTMDEYNAIVEAYSHDHKAHGWDHDFDRGCPRCDQCHDYVEMMADQPEQHAITELVCPRCGFKIGVSQSATFTEGS